MHGTGRTWDYVIAERLHKTVAEVKAMDNEEYEYWQEYITVQGVLRELQQRTEVSRGSN